MYKTDINKKISHLFSGSYPNKYTNNSLNYYENVKKELEAMRTKQAKILFRKKLMEHQDKVNYTNEVNRLRGELSRNDARFPIGTREKIIARVNELKRLGATIAD